MKILDENNRIVDINKIETDEQEIVRHIIEPNDVVLELGGRYGSVSCIINSKLANKYNHVVVEPDDRVWEALEINKLNNDCFFHIVKGFISNKKLSLINKNVFLNGYGSTSILDDSSKIKSFTLDYIQNKYNLKFNTLVADCEGFLEQFFEENPKMYEQLHKITFEADYPEKCNYGKIINNLMLYNFKCIKNGFHSVWIKS
jgi:FkbM family methyltransferase